MNFIKSIAALACLLLVQTAHAEYQSPTTFRDMTWGADLSAMKGSFSLVETSGDLKCYFKKNDNLKIGDASLKEIRYCFYKEKFMFVSIKFAKITNFSIIKDTLTQKYGEPSEESHNDYWWGISQPIAINLAFVQMVDLGSLAFRYKPLVDQMSQDQKERNTKASGDI